MKKLYLLFTLYLFGVASLPAMNLKGMSKIEEKVVLTIFGIPFIGVDIRFALCAVKSHSLQQQRQ